MQPIPLVHETNGKQQRAQTKEAQNPVALAQLAEIDEEILPIATASSTSACQRTTASDSKNLLQAKQRRRA